jgi:polysaccharide biosynthesis/export protein
MIKLKINISLIITGIILIMYSGCVTQHDLEYMQQSGQATKTFKESEVPDYRLKPNDELFIQVNSLEDPSSAEVFSLVNGQQRSSSTTLDPYAASLLAYSINKEGFLQLPLLGSIYVKDKTLSEVRSLLTDSLSHILSQPIVTVKMVNRFISVLGDVGRPGHYSYSQDKLSIFDAIGLAGDMTTFANRTEVLLTRNELGKNTMVHLDLTDPNILASEYYYIRPNDIIFVKPLKKRIWGMPEFPFGIILSTLSVTLLFYSVVK